MKNLSSQLTIALGLGIACSLSLVNPTIVRSQNPDEGNYQSNEKDSLYGDSTLGIDPMQLIHQYNLSTGRSAEEFSEESRTQIKNSAEEFRRLQRERMLQQYNTAPNSTEKTGE